MVSPYGVYSRIISEPKIDVIPIMMGTKQRISTKIERGTYVPWLENITSSYEFWLLLPLSPPYHVYPSCYSSIPGETWSPCTSPSMVLFQLHTPGICLLRNTVVGLCMYTHTIPLLLAPSFVITATTPPFLTTSLSLTPAPSSLNNFFIESQISRPPSCHNLYLMTHL